MNPNETPQHATVFDDATLHVARVYAEALLNAAQQAGQAAEVVEDLDSLVNDVFPRDRYLEAFLTSRAVGRDPGLDTRVDAGLLGGMTVQVGDVLYDASVRTRLERIRNQLLERSSHAIQSERDRLRSPE